MNCPTCGQSMPDALTIRHITDAELDALSAWWWTRSVRSAARLLGLADQTVKNQLANARQRNGAHKTIELVQTFGGRLRSIEEVAHNVAARQREREENRHAA